MLRPVNRTDIEALYSIYNDEAVVPFMSFDHQTRSQFDECFNILNSRDMFLVWLEADEVCAATTIIRGKWRTYDVATVASLAVPSRHQGKGVGTRMMKALIEAMRKEGVRRLQLSVEADNPGAIRLYEKVGFMREGVMKQYFNRSPGVEPVDDIMMGMLL